MKTLIFSLLIMFSFSVMAPVNSAYACGTEKKSTDKADKTEVEQASYEKSEEARSKKDCDSKDKAEKARGEKDCGSKSKAEKAEDSDKDDKATADVESDE